MKFKAMPGRVLTLCQSLVSCLFPKARFVKLPGCILTSLQTEPWC
jgi:hypothetical protein